MLLFTKIYAIFGAVTQRDFRTKIQSTETNDSMLRSGDGPAFWIFLGFTDKG